MLDIKIFVETDADVRILRRALRDVRDRGRTLESVITQYLTTVKPMHEQFVDSSFYLLYAIYIALIYMLLKLYLNVCN